MRRLALSFTVLAWALAACGTGVNPSATGPAGSAMLGSPGPAETSTLRIARSAGLTFSDGAFYKLEEDLPAQGIEVQTDVFDSSQDAFRAMIAGEADMAEGTFLGAVSLAQAGGGAKVVACDQKAPDYLFISTAGIESLADLVGKRVGISTPGDTSDTLSRLVLSREGVDEDAVDYVQIGGTSARMAGLLADQLDAGLAHAAEGINAVQQSDGGLKALWRVGETVPSYLQRCLMVSDEFLAANPNLTQITVDTFLEAVRWAAATENEDAYVDLACARVELTAEVCHEAFKLYDDIGMWALNGGVETDRITESIAIEQEVGSLQGDVPEVNEFLDSSFVESYLERFGTETE
jgi:NitT/TauT family transport system substrate-binding protein